MACMANSKSKIQIVRIQKIKAPYQRFSILLLLIVLYVKDIAFCIIHVMNSLKCGVFSISCILIRRVTGYVHSLTCWKYIIHSIQIHESKQANIHISLFQYAVCWARCQVLVVSHEPARHDYQQTPVAQHCDKCNWTKVPESTIFDFFTQFLNA